MGYITSVVTVITNKLQASRMLHPLFAASSMLNGDAETTVMANELKNEGFTVVSLDPGNVSTALWDYLLKNIFSPSCAMVTERGLQPRQPDQTPEESVHDMLELTLKLTPKDTGKFILYNGEELSW